MLLSFHHHFLPGEEKATAIRALGQSVIRALVRASSRSEITPYFHALVCAIPRQSRRFDIMDLSGQVITVALIIESHHFTLHCVLLYQCCTIG